MLPPAEPVALQADGLVVEHPPDVVPAGLRRAPHSTQARTVARRSPILPRSSGELVESRYQYIARGIAGRPRQVEDLVEPGAVGPPVVLAAARRPRREGAPPPTVVHSVAWAARCTPITRTTKPATATRAAGGSVGDATPRLEPFRDWALALHRLHHGDAHVGRALGDRDARGAEGVLLLGGRALAARDDRAGVAHALARGRRRARDERRDGLRRRAPATKAAASSSAVPPISPIRRMPSVSGSSSKSFSASTKSVPGTGSPPMPRQVVCPRPSSVSCHTAS